MRIALAGSALLALSLAASARGQAAAAPGAVPAAGLMREGSSLVEARGSLERHAQTRRWIFRTEQPPHREFTLLPCTLLGSLETLVESSPDRHIVFDLSGQVYAYQQRNYLLPTHAPRLVDYVAPPAPAAGSAAAGSAEAMLRDLERSVGPVARAPDAVAEGATAPPPARHELPPGTLLMWRRGWMVHEPSGDWSFVFEADATGRSDPPVLLMPCLLLESMEEHAGKGGPQKPLLLCGFIHRYHGRTYLMPTMFQVPRNSTPLRP